MRDRLSHGRIPELDGLRGIAILVVLLYHYIGVQPGGEMHSWLAYFQRLFSMGWMGVDLFFVLSGFLIGGILLDARTSPTYFSTFYLRRFYRIVPLYYAWVLGYFVLRVVAGGSLSAAMSHVTDPQFPVYQHFLFLQNFYYIRNVGLLGAWFAALWSLAVEEQFYLLSPLFVRLLPIDALKAALSSIILGAPALRLCLLLLFHVDPSVVFTLMPSRADALALGVLAAVIWRNDRMREKVASNLRILYGVLAGLVAGALVLWKISPEPFSFAMETGGLTLAGLLCTVLLLVALLIPANPIARVARMRWLREIGGVSYCMYIIHSAVNLFCHAIFLHSRATFIGWKAQGVTALAAVITYAVAKTSWVFLEEPLLRRGHAYKY